MINANTYAAFLASKAQVADDDGFEASWVPEWLFGFQRDLVTWALAKGRAAIFADCGLGKTPMQLVWAENVVRKTNKPVLVLTPLAVGRQTVREAEKFGVDAVQSRDGKWKQGARVVVTNYERLHYFEPDAFAGVVCDESSILKNFAGVTREAVTEFMRTRPYRLLCTATAAPNDFTELGTSSEALGYLRRVEMLAMYMSHDGGSTQKWTLKEHAKHPFWKYVVSWARAIRKPSDMGYADGAFVLPELNTRQHVVSSKGSEDGWLFDLPAVTLNEQRKERRRTIEQRCEMVADLVNDGQPAVSWCYLNEEGDLLERMIYGAVQVSGKDSDERKEDVFRAFSDGDIRVLVTKPTIAGFGLNWQHCAHQTFFPSHSFEQWYQAVRRSWRFGQKQRVVVDVVTSEGEANVLANLQRKAEQAERLFEEMVRLIEYEAMQAKSAMPKEQEAIPSWL